MSFSEGRASVLDSIPTGLIDQGISVIVKTHTTGLMANTQHTGGAPAKPLGRKREAFDSETVGRLHSGSGSRRAALQADPPAHVRDEHWAERRKHGPDRERGHVSTAGHAYC